MDRLVEMVGVEGLETGLMRLMIGPVVGLTDLVGLVVGLVGIWTVGMEELGLEAEMLELGMERLVRGRMPALAVVR